MMSDPRSDMYDMLPIASLDDSAVSPLVNDVSVLAVEHQPMRAMPLNPMFTMWSMAMLILVSNLTTSSSRVKPCVLDD